MLECTGKSEQFCGCGSSAARLAYICLCMIASRTTIFSTVDSPNIFDSDMYEQPGPQGLFAYENIYVPHLHRCNFSAPVPISVHTESYRASKHKLECQAKIIDTSSGQIVSRPTVSAQVCESKLRGHAGSDDKLIVTRVGAPKLSVGQSFTLQNFLPAVPMQLPAGRAFLTEYFYWMRQSDGRLLSSPPVYVHHFVSRVSG